MADDGRVDGPAAEGGPVAGGVAAAGGVTGGGGAHEGGAGLRDVVAGRTRASWRYRALVEGDRWGTRLASLGLCSSALLYA